MTIDGKIRYDDLLAALDIESIPGCAHAGTRTLQAAHGALAKVRGEQ